MRARARFLLGDLERADQDLSRAIELAPESSRAYFERGIVRLERSFAGSALYREPEVADAPDPWRRGAVEDFRRSKEKGLGWPESLIVDAAGAWQSGGPDAAVARSSDPAWESASLEELHRFRGEALAAKGEYAAAERALTRAIQMRGHYPEALLARGLVRLKTGEYRDAAEDLTYCVERRRFLEPALYARGQANYSQGRYSAALTDWRRCIEIAPARADRLRELMKDAQARSQF
jgi:tetratricopeptide (TPR) repeat protein